MSIQTTDFQFRLSGGPANTDPLASIGGAKSNTAVNPLTLFDKVTSAEAAAGDIEYRCVYLVNGHATLTMQQVVAWMLANTPSATTNIDIGAGTSGLNGVEAAVANENTAPAGVTFSAPANKASAVALGGDIPPGQHRAIWLRRTINAGTTAADETWSVQADCDSAP